MNQNIQLNSARSRGTVDSSLSALLFSGKSGRSRKSGRSGASHHRSFYGEEVNQVEQTASSKQLGPSRKINVQAYHVKPQSKSTQKKIKMIDTVEDMNQMNQTIQKKMQNKYYDLDQKRSFDKKRSPQKKPSPKVRENKSALTTRSNEKGAAFNKQRASAAPTSNYYKKVEDLRTKSATKIGQGVFRRKSQSNGSLS